MIAPHLLPVAEVAHAEGRLWWCATSADGSLIHYDAGQVREWSFFDIQPDAWSPLIEEPVADKRGWQVMRPDHQFFRPEGRAARQHAHSVWTVEVTHLRCSLVDGTRATAGRMHFLGQAIEDNVLSSSMRFVVGDEGNDWDPRYTRSLLTREELVQFRALRKARQQTENAETEALRKANDVSTQLQAFTQQLEEQLRRGASPPSQEASRANVSNAHVQALMQRLENEQ